MRYVSTRPGGESSITSAEAIWQGISASGGLFVPEFLPKISLDEIVTLAKVPYHQRASVILPLFLTDYSLSEIQEFTGQAYSTPQFDSEDCAPVRFVSDNTWSLELWHGPTCAFKDMALQLLPRLLTGAMKKVGEGRKVAILVATSGDTGKAALDGFADVDGTEIIVFYPAGGVSKVQEAQMVTQEGHNVNVVAVEGNFDDTQTGVKKIFADKGVAVEASAKGVSFSSANSINWGRLVPQIVYYFSAYADLVAKGSVKPGEEINFVVPTGNFGNILAGYYAKLMGLPIKKLICASNENNVLTDFFKEGRYDRRRPFRRTSSPSMDILISSNLERLLFEISGRRADVVAEWMRQLVDQGTYSLDESGLASDTLKAFWAEYASEDETLETLKKVWTENGYLIDTHTAVAFNVLTKYRQQTGDGAVSIVLSTASPFKFNEDVAKAVMGQEAIAGLDEFTLLGELSAYTGVPVPKGLQGLDKIPVRHGSVCRVDEMRDVVRAALKL